MRLLHLSLTNFRNFTRLALELPPRGVLLIGANAQGKTNFLEAVYLLATFSSFQTHVERQLIHFLETRKSPAVGRLIGEYQRRDGTHRLELRLILEATAGDGMRLRKEALLDGVKRPLSQIVGHFNAVLFAPHMTQIIEGSPEERRRFLNLTLAQAIPGYAMVLSEYVHILEQRNALLKQLAAQAGHVAQLDVWDQELTARGAQLMYWRIQALQEMERLAARVHLELTRGAEVLRLMYRPAYEPLPLPVAQISLPLSTPLDRSHLKVEEIREGFLERLRAMRREELTRGVTLIGPHRDEVRFLANGIDLGDYGSRGQVRTALLSLKLAEMEWMRLRNGEWPVLLLDEVLSELDSQRREDLLARVSTCEQVILTATDASAFPAPFLLQSTLWEVKMGQIYPKNHLAEEKEPG
jgi:DNA replication and repair protein RecF